MNTTGMTRRRRRGRPGSRLALAAAVAIAAAGCQSAPVTSVPPAAGTGMATPAPGRSAPVPAAAPSRPEATGRGPTPLLPDGPVGASAPRRGVGGVFLGTDRTTAAPRAAAPAVTRGTGETYTLNFVDADIAEVVRSILVDILGETFVMDPAVQGKVTLQSGRPQPRDTLIATLEQILALHNATLVRQETLYRIVPAENAARGAGLARADSEAGPAPGTGVVVVPLQHVTAAEMQKVIAPFLKPGATVQTDATRNVLLVGGDRSDRRTVQDLVGIFDVDWLAGMSFAIVPVEAAQARSVAGELQQIFAATQPDGSDAGLIRFVPVDRLNAVLVVSPRASYVEKAQQWVARLDVSEVDAPRIYVYPCQYARAEELASVLNQVFGEKQRDGAQLAPGLRPATLQGSAASSAAGGDASSGAGGFSGAAPPSDATSGSGRVPGPPAASIDALRSGGGRAVAGSDGEGTLVPEPGAVRIIADPIKNTLVVLATPATWQLIQSALGQMDVESLQVLVEATFVEVTLTEELELGTQWFFDVGNNALFFPNAAPASAAGFFNWVLVAQGGDIRVALRALQTVTEVNVLSSPNLMVLDNQFARIQIGDQVPIRTQTSQAVTGGDAPIVSTIEYRDTGTILNMRPRVNASGLVQVELQQEVSNVARTTSSDIDSPTINQRSLQSTVAVHDGESIVLGGLMERQRDRSRSGLPWLSQIPILGLLFGTTQDNDTKRELIVIITPSIARNALQAGDITDDLQQRMTRLRPLFEQFRIRAPNSRIGS